MKSIVESYAEAIELNIALEELLKQGLVYRDGDGVYHLITSEEEIND